MNDPATVKVRRRPVRSGSTARRAPDARVVQAMSLVDEDTERTENPRLLDWVPSGEPLRAPNADYPIEGGVPHPTWIGDPAQPSLGTHRVVVDAGVAVVRLLVALTVAAFLLGLTVFYPVSPLGH
jgi:hypothetical protein